MPALTPDIPQVEMQIVAMTNAFRREHRLGALAPNDKLAAAARAYAANLASSGTFSHTADGREPGDRAETAGYVYCQVAENLALALDSRGFTADGLAHNAVEGWKNSPGHRANMLAPHVTETGVAVVKAPDKHPKYISVQLLGRPRSLQYSFEVRNFARRVVTYTFDGEKHEVSPNTHTTHTECVPLAIAFEPANSASGSSRVSGSYEAKDGQIYTLRPDGAGYRVELGAARR